MEAVRTSETSIYINETKRGMSSSKNFLIPASIKITLTD
jgi:hypothetical protein